MNTPEWEEHVKELDSILYAGIQETNERRDKWQEIAKNIIVPTLEKARDLLEKNGKTRYVYVTRHEVFTNFETIEFFFGQRPNGISVKDAKGAASGRELGAALVFSLADAGNIFVSAKPFQSILPREDAQQQESYLGRIFNDPGEITEELVQEICISFLSWAASTAPFSVTNRDRIPCYSKSVKWLPWHEHPGDEADKGQIGFKTPPPSLKKPTA